MERIIQGTPYSEYSSIHHWLRFNYGKALKCENDSCNGKSKSFNWALKKGKKYERKRRNFKQLCRSCHAILDCTEETRKKMSLGGKNKDTEALRKERKCETCPKIINAFVNQKYCKECAEISKKIKDKQRGEANKKEMKMYKKNYFIKNRERINAYYREYWRIKRLNQANDKAEEYLK